MTKKQLLKFGKSQGWECNYSGHNKTVYIEASNVKYVKEIRLIIIQHFGYIPEEINIIYGISNGTATRSSNMCK